RHECRVPLVRTSSACGSQSRANGSIAVMAIDRWAYETAWKPDFSCLRLMAAEHRALQARCTMICKRRNASWAIERASHTSSALRIEQVARGQTD
ncbi:hypothetical protein, partial [Xanthomonas vasicola]